MPAVQQRSDAADGCFRGGRRNRRVGQLMIFAIKYASAGRTFPVAQVRTEVCLDPVSAAQGVSVSLRRCRFLRLPTLQNTSCARFSVPSLPIAILSRLPLQYRDLPKHIACGMLQRLNTTEF